MKRANKVVHLRFEFFSGSSVVDDVICSFDLFFYWKLGIEFLFSKLGRAMVTGHDTFDTQLSWSSDDDSFIYFWVCVLRFKEKRDHIND